MMDKFFDCLNVTNLVTGYHSLKSFKDPYTSKDDFRLKVCILCVSELHYGDGIVLVDIIYFINLHSVLIIAYLL